MAQMSQMIHSGFSVHITIKHNILYTDNKSLDKEQKTKSYGGVTTPRSLVCHTALLVGPVAYTVYTRGSQLNEPKCHIVPNMSKFLFIFFVFERF